MPARAQLSDAAGAHAPAQTVRDLAIEAYIFGYPLVTMEMTRRAMTNVARPEGLRGPMGQFASAREYATLNLFVANPLNRYTLSARNAPKSGPDGPIELLLQASNAGPDKEAN